MDALQTMGYRAIGRYQKFSMLCLPYWIRIVVIVDDLVAFCLLVAQTRLIRLISAVFAHKNCLNEVNYIDFSNFVEKYLCISIKNSTFAAVESKNTKICKKN